MKHQKWIVWSIDPDESQAFTDIYRARSLADAVAKVRRARPYAVIDSVSPAMLLAGYIQNLQEALTR